MICRSIKVKEILDKIAEKRKQLDESKNLFERQLLRKELRDLKLILRDMLYEED